MSYMISPQDTAFKEQVEACTFPIPKFDHRAHLRLAYIYLVENETDEAIREMRYFMGKTEESDSADRFINSNPEILDSKIMITHYSAEVLFSDKARIEFVEPNLDPIPKPNAKNT